mmetsp:Transcript_3045/g.3542  ORF Transcript_3045/g.3542 Transcript_3045/m.3542 type:complete len:120 (-) Transcript_3045:45-404(-)
MGKKGKKKKAKDTGTPDVVKFKGTREFCLLKESVTIQESLPFVAVDPLDDLAFKKVARFLNMVGLLAEHLQVQSNKDYRFIHSSSNTSRSSLSSHLKRFRPLGKSSLSCGSMSAAIFVM